MKSRENLEKINQINSDGRLSKASADSGNHFKGSSALRSPCRSPRKGPRVISYIGSLTRATRNEQSQERFRSPKQAEAQDILRIQEAKISTRPPIASIKSLKQAVNKIAPDLSKSVLADKKNPQRMRSASDFKTPVQLNSLKDQLSTASTEKIATRRRFGSGDPTTLTSKQPQTEQVKKEDAIPFNF